MDAVGQTLIRYFPARETGSLRDYYFEFGIASQNAASFGLSLRMDECRLRFAPLSADIFEMTLTRYPPPLDDFWADQYDLHLPREVDGQKLRVILWKSETTS